MMVGRLLSFLDGIFSGAMLNFQGVYDEKQFPGALSRNSKLALAWTSHLQKWGRWRESLVGGFNQPIWKIIRKSNWKSYEIFPQLLGMKTKKMSKTTT